MPRVPSRDSAERWAGPWPTRGALRSNDGAPGRAWRHTRPPRRRVRTNRTPRAGWRAPAGYGDGSARWGGSAPPRTSACGCVVGAALDGNPQTDSARTADALDDVGSSPWIGDRRRVLIDREVEAGAGAVVVGAARADGGGERRGVRGRRGGEELSRHGRHGRGGPLRRRCLRIAGDVAVWLPRRRGLRRPNDPTGRRSVARKRLAWVPTQPICRDGLAGRDAESGCRRAEIFSGVGGHRDES